MATCSSPVTSASKRFSKKKKNKKPSTETRTKKRKNKTDSNATQKPISSSSHTQRKKSETKVRVIKGNKIYDSENGKYCHQCRHKTFNCAATCNNHAENKQCSLHFCHKCLLNRYGEKVEEAVVLGIWKCPKCRGICNCSNCMKKRGCSPTGVLAHPVSSVSDMLHLKGPKSSGSKKFAREEASRARELCAQQMVGGERTKAWRARDPAWWIWIVCLGAQVLGLYKHIVLPWYPKKCLEARKSLVLKHAGASTRESGEENGFHGKTDSLLPPQALKINGKGKEARNSKLKRFGSNDERKNVCKGNRDNDAHMEKGGSKKRRIYKDESKKGKGMDCRDDNGRLTKRKSDLHVSKKIPAKTIKTQKNETKLPKKDKVAVVKIPMPKGTELNNVAAIGIPAEDVGHALQFLEFCEAFGKVLNINKGQPESLLRDLVCGRSRRRMEDSAVVQFHIRLLSMLRKHSGKEYPSSWLQALNKCISESRYILKDLQLECFDVGGGGYDELDTSKKLRLLNFLCDEVLGTEVLRNWIDEQNSKYITREKSVKEEVLAAEKSMTKKMHDEVVRTLVDKNGLPVSISEHMDIVSKMKTEAATDTVRKKEHRSNAVRSEPILLDENGHKFWKLSSYSGEMDILLQDLGEDLVAAKDRWFTYDVEQRTKIENYISSSRKLIK